MRTSIFSNKYALPVLLVIIGVFSSLLYFFGIRELVVEAYEGNAPGWFSHLVDTVYPRFVVEKQRFSLSFFLHKSDQLILRFNIVLICLAVGITLSSERVVRQSFRRLTNVRKDKLSLKILLLIFYTGYLSYVSVWYEDLQLAVTLKDFYKPIPLYDLLGIGLPSVEVLHGVYYLMMITGILVIIGVLPFYSSLVNTISFLYLQGFFYCFEKTDHRFATLTMAVMLMPFLTHLFKYAASNRTFNAWPVQLIRLGIAMAYFLAGMEILLSSGFQWASARTFRAYIEMHEAPLGMKLASSDFLAHALPVAALIFQLSFILIVFLPRYRVYFMAAGVLFHIGTVYLFNIGDVLTPWLFMYIFFIDWRWLRHRAKYAWRGGEQR